MTLKDIISAINSRLQIKKLNAMQEATAAITPPCRLLLLAPTGSGKTVAFALPFLRSLPAPGRGQVGGVIIAPSRELVLQIYEVIRRIATGFKTVAFYGGHPMADEVRSVIPEPDIIVATPGRLLDHLRRGTLSLDKTSALVLDEYDKSLDLGFDDEMRRISARMKNIRTIILTSATKLQTPPQYLDTRGMRTLDFTGAAEKAPAPKLDIAIVESPVRDKLQTLADLLASMAPASRVMVFVNHRDAAERIHSDMRRRGFPAGLYHGGLEQQQRERALVMFGNGTTPVLVSTDLAARGLDIPAVEAVVHYHMPVDAEAWTHRNGRTARQGSEGHVYIINSEADDIPEFIRWDHPYTPTATSGGNPAESPWQTLHINAGKKEKISRGDVAGFLIHKGGLQSAQVGTIDIRDHCAYVAVPRELARELVKTLIPHRMKNTRVRVSLIDD